MSNLTCLCRIATTFTKAGELDEDAFRQFLQRFVDAGLGVYLASAGSGEGHALKWDELRRVYEIGVAVCKGKVPVNANPPEQHTARLAREHTLLAIAANVDVVNVYGPASWHGFKPTDQEYQAYYDDVLSGINHPIAIAPNPIIGYTPTPASIVEVCRKYHQVVAVNLSGVGTDYFADINRFIRYVRRWQSSTPRWLKMAMSVLNLPGGEGALREPYRMPPDPVVQKFADGLLRLGLPEIEEQARAAGLRIPQQ